MKKYFLSFFIFMIAAGTLSAQSFQLGLRAAPLFSYIKPTSDGFDSDGLKVGFSYGLVTDFNIGENYAFRTGISIVSEGGNIKSGPDSLITHTSLVLQYLEIPLTLKFRTSQLGAFKYYGQFGLGTGFNLKATTEGNVESSKGSTVNTSPFKNDDAGKDINLINLQLIIGGGLEYSLGGRTALTAGIAYHNGFTDVLSADNQKATCSYIAINTGILF